MFQDSFQSTAEPLEVGCVMSRLQMPPGREDRLKASRIDDLAMRPTLETVMGSIMSSRPLGMLLRHPPRPYLHPPKEGSLVISTHVTAIPWSCAVTHLTNIDVGCSYSTDCRLNTTSRDNQLAMGHGRLGVLHGSYDRPARLVRVSVPSTWSCLP